MLAWLYAISVVLIIIRSCTPFGSDGADCALAGTAIEAASIIASETARMLFAIFRRGCSRLLIALQRPSLMRPNIPLSSPRQLKAGATADHGVFAIAHEVAKAEADTAIDRQPVALRENAFGDDAGHAEAHCIGAVERAPAEAHAELLVGREHNGGRSKRERNASPQSRDRLEGVSAVRCEIAQRVRGRQLQQA